MAYVAFGLYVLLLLACFIAGSPAVTRSNEDIGEADDCGIENTNPTA